MNNSVIVNRPDDSFYCRFDADEKLICITLDNGYKVFLDRKVEPYLKKFLDALGSTGIPPRK